VRRPLQLLAGIVVLAAALRLWRLGHQSYWLDEAFTVNTVRRDFGGMLDGVRHTESTPPLYYTLAWVWERIFGAGEVGLRSLSAVIGIATVPVAYLAARARVSERAALIAAALFAVNPYLVWYSQEARAYALLVLLCTASLLFFLRTEHEHSVKGTVPLTRRSLWLWALFSALALLTHYFAAFLVVPEAAWLLWRHRSRAVGLAVAAPLAVGAALLPLAIAQRDAGHTLFIGDIPFGRRLVSIPKKVATGELGTPTPVIGVLLGVILVVGAALALRHRAGLLLALAAAPVAIALVLKVAGLDYVFPRNLIEAFVPFLIAAAAGLAAIRAGPWLAAALAVAGAALVIQTSLNTSLQRDDWRGAARALVPATAVPRAIVVTPEVAKTPLRLYAGELPLVPPSGARVREIDLLANARPPRFAPSPPPPGFALTARRRTESWQLVRYVARSARRLTVRDLQSLRLDRDSDPVLLLQRRG
jgi:4-amino-4-deoxy-L-arabinose transferase-like glycosyltransferase